MARPSKMTDRCKRQILEYVRAGLSRPDAARSAGIHHRTLNRYLERGALVGWGPAYEFIQAVEAAEADYTEMMRKHREELRKPWAEERIWTDNRGGVHRERTYYNLKPGEEPSQDIPVRRVERAS